MSYNKQSVKFTGLKESENTMTHWSPQKKKMHTAKVSAKKYPIMFKLTNHTSLYHCFEIVVIDSRVQYLGGYSDLSWTEVCRSSLKTPTHL